MQIQIPTITTKPLSVVVVVVAGVSSGAGRAGRR